MTFYNKYETKDYPTLLNDNSNEANSSLVEDTVKIVNNMPNILNNYVKAHKRYIKFVKEYTNMKDKNSSKLNQVINVTSNSGSVNGYFTNNGYFLPNKTNVSLGKGCAINSSINGGNVDNLNYDMSTSSDKDHNEFIIGKEYIGQPCVQGGMLAYVSNSTPIDEDNVNDEGCFTKSTNLMEQKDMGFTTYEDCRDRAGHLGTKVFGLSDFDLGLNKGKCKVSNKIDGAKIGNSIIEKESLFIQTRDTGGTLTLLKDGTLIIWNCNAGDSNWVHRNQGNTLGDICKDSDGKNISNASIPYDKKTKEIKSAIIWNSLSHGGKKVNQCHMYYGGAINNIDASYGLNCVVNPAKFV